MRNVFTWCNDHPGLAEKIPTCDSADRSALHAFHKQMGETK
jgi:hypothetical protein